MKIGDRVKMKRRPYFSGVIYAEQQKLWGGG